VVGRSQDISAHPGVGHSTRSDGTFSRADFVFDRERNVYICPGGKLLHTTGTVIDGGTLRYRAFKRDCDVCAFKNQRPPTRRCGRFLAICMRMPEMSPAHWPRPKLSNNPVGNAKSRNAVCAHEAHLQARSTEPAGSGTKCS
jgi:hypothetical protein